MYIPVLFYCAIKNKKMICRDTFRFVEITFRFETLQHFVLRIIISKNAAAPLLLPFYLFTFLPLKKGGASILADRSPTQ